MKTKSPLGSIPTLGETRVLELAAQGLSLVQVAEHLRLSHDTVRTHIRSLHLRLGVHNRASLIRVATEKGLICPPLPREPLKDLAQRLNRKRRAHAGTPGAIEKALSQGLRPVVVVLQPQVKCCPHCGCNLEAVTGALALAGFDKERNGVGSE